MPALAPTPAPTDFHSVAAAPTAPLDRFLTRLFLVIWAGLAVILFTARGLNPGPETGECSSDSNVINACRVYDTQGFLADHALPRLESATAPPDTRSLYLTYPPGPYWITYAAWTTGRLLGLDPLLSARFFAQAIGILTGLLAFRLFSRLSGNIGLGALAALFYILSLPYTSYSAALHHMTYSPALLMGAMLAWLAFERTPRPTCYWFLALAAGLYAIDCWTNLEHIAFFALFIAIRTLCHFRLPVFLGAVLLASLPVPLMALRIAHNTLALGSWERALRHLGGAATRRSTGGSDGFDHAELLQVWLRRLGADGLSHWDHAYAYPILDPWVLSAIGATLIAGLLAHQLRRRAIRHAHLAPLPAVPRSPVTPISLGLLNGLLLLAAGASWFLIMTQHTLQHSFIVLLLMPGLALLLGTLCWGTLRSAALARPAQLGFAGWWARAHCSLVVLALVALFARHLNRSDVLNQLAPLNAVARERVLDLRQRNALMSPVASHLRTHGLSRLVMFDGAHYATWRAASADMPFTYARTSMPRLLAPDQALHVQIVDGNEREQAALALVRWGLPTFVGSIQHRTLVFTPPDTPTLPTDGLVVHLDPPIRFDASFAPPESPAESSTPPGTAEQVTITNIALSRPIGGDHAIASLVVIAPPPDPNNPEGDGDRMGHRFEFTLRIRDANGRVIAERETRMAWAVIRRQGVCLLAVVFTEAELASGAILELSIRDRRQRAMVRLEHPDLSLFGPSARRSMWWPIPPIVPP